MVSILQRYSQMQKIHSVIDTVDFFVDTTESELFFLISCGVSTTFELNILKPY